MNEVFVGDGWTIWRTQQR